MIYTRLATLVVAKRNSVVMFVHRARAARLRRRPRGGSRPVPSAPSPHHAIADAALAFLCGSPSGDGDPPRVAVRVFW